MSVDFVTLIKEIVPHRCVHNSGQMSLCEAVPVVWRLFYTTELHDVLPFQTLPDYTSSIQARYTTTMQGGAGINTGFRDQCQF